MARGGQPHYSALAIRTVLALRAVFQLALRQTDGLISSILKPRVLIWLCRKPFVSEFQLLLCRLKGRRVACSRAGILIGQ